MNTHAGYSKRTLADTNVLLTGGGDKSLADFLGGIQYVSASNKIQIKTAANNASWTDLVTLVTTDENVKQTPKVDNVNRPLMMINGGTSIGEQINTSMFSTGIYANASTKMITANGFIKAGSSASYVLLGDGSHKNVSDFATSGHNHDSSYVSSLTTSGNYLRWIKGGNNNDITIPYAIYAGYAPQLSQTSISSLSSFTHSTNLIYTAAGGSNSVSDKPSGVDAFGVISYKTASSWYGQLLTGINSGGTSSNLYWRTASTLSGGWKKILDSNNSSVSKSGETLTVKINDVSQSLTNTWRDITDSYLETNTGISLSQKGGNDLYNELVNGPANYINCYKEMTVSPGAITAWTWYSTGIAGPTLNSGIYVLKISIHTAGPFWRCNFVGLLYWFSSGTNASEDDEVIMHSAGHANNNNVHIYIRTLKRESGTLLMQMTSNINLSAYVYTFRFFKIGD